MTDRTEVSNGGSIGTSLNDKQVLMAETGDMTVSVGNGASTLYLLRQRSLMGAGHRRGRHQRHEPRHQVRILHAHADGRCLHGQHALSEAGRRHLGAAEGHPDLQGQHRRMGRHAAVRRHHGEQPPVAEPPHQPHLGRRQLQGRHQGRLQRHLCRRQGQGRPADDDDTGLRLRFARNV